MASKFKLNSAASKQAAQKATAKGGGFKRWRMQGEQAKILVVGPVAENEPVFGTNIVHQHFGKDNSFICKAASPEAFEKKDKLKEIGWKLKNKYDPKEGEGKKHPNKKIQELWKMFMPKKIYTINIIDLSNVDAGVQQYDAPSKVMELLFDEINDSADDLTSICDLQEGRQLLIKKSGKGLMTRYLAKFSQKTANLDLTPEEEEALVAQVKPLSKTQEPFDEAAYEKVVDYVTSVAEKLGVDLSDLDNNENEDDEEEIDVDEEEVEEIEEELGDESLEDDIAEVDEDEEEEEPAPKKKPAPKAKK